MPADDLIPLAPPRRDADAAPSALAMADAIRVLAMDAVEQAGCGHPGMPMGMADVATVLFTKALKYDAAAPDWADRDGSSCPTVTARCCNMRSCI